MGKIKKKIYVLAIIDEKSAGNDLETAERFADLLGRTWANDLSIYQSQGFEVFVEIEISKNCQSTCSVEIDGSFDISEFDVREKLTKYSSVFDKFRSE